MSRQARVRRLVVPAMVALCGLVRAAAGPATGPLKVHPQNPRYFADASGKAVLLVGSHTWNTLVDMGKTDPPSKFDYAAHLDFLEKHHHNFMRLWTWECTTWDTKANRREALNHCAPSAWARTGPGNALDGKPKFDLAKFDDAYFERLRSRVAAARDRGIYVSIMLFEGWAMQFAAGAWESHPFHPKNNIAELNGDPNGDGKGLEVHERAVKAITAVPSA